MLDDPTVSPTVAFDHLILSKHEAHTHLFTPIPEHRQGKGLATHWPPYLGSLTIRLHGPGWWGGQHL